MRCFGTKNGFKCFAKIHKTTWKAKTSVSIPCSTSFDPFRTVQGAYLVPQSIWHSLLRYACIGYPSPKFKRSPTKIVTIFVLPLYLQLCGCGVPKPLRGLHAKFSRPRAGLHPWSCEWVGLKKEAPTGRKW